MLQSLSDRPDDRALRTTICAGVDAVFLSLHTAIEGDDDELWSMAKKLVGDRSDLMSNIRRTYRQSGQPLDEAARARIVEITNTVEQIFFLLSKLVRELDASPIPSTYDLVSRHMRPDRAGSGPHRADEADRCKGHPRTPDGGRPGHGRRVRAADHDMQ